MLLLLLLLLLGPITTATDETVTQESFVDLQNYHTQNEKDAVDLSLVRFQKIYQKNKKTIQGYMKKNCKHNESSRNLMRAIAFLRHFLCHYDEQKIRDPEDRETLLSEVIGLMTSILQAVMNAKQLDRYRHKPYLRELFLGDRLRACIDESKLVDGDFVYSFPKVFIENRFIRGNWFTRNLACEKVTFSSSLEEKECYDTVIGFFVELYDNNLKTRPGKLK